MQKGVHFLDKYPLAGMKPGDHYITNDPWLTSGHLHDITVVTPTFYRGHPVALFANTIHVVDIGGLGMGPDGRQVFEEGLAIPIMPLARAGAMNEDLLRLVRANVREPLQVEGDIYATAASNDEGSRRLIEMMNEFEIANLDDDNVGFSRRQIELFKVLFKVVWFAQLGEDSKDTTNLKHDLGHSVDVSMLDRVYFARHGDRPGV